eukprot:scaffold139308_cov48-Tisochrysis_lutea.AAC.1
MATNHKISGTITDYPTPSAHGGDIGWADLVQPNIDPPTTNRYTMFASVACRLHPSFEASLRSQSLRGWYGVCVGKSNFGAEAMSLDSQQVDAKLQPRKSFLAPLGAPARSGRAHEHGSVQMNATIGCMALQPS